MAFEPTAAPETVVSGLPLSGDHPMHPFAIDSQGNLYVDLGSATNSCQSQNRMPNVPGNNPCTELETRAGTWRYDANKLDQHFAPAECFVTGLRNGEGISFDSAGRIWATQHGRDQLGQNWPKLYTLKQNANLPAEELVQLRHGSDFGWPECGDRSSKPALNSATAARQRIEADQAAGSGANAMRQIGFRGAAYSLKRW